MCIWICFCQCQYHTNRQVTSSRPTDQPQRRPVNQTYSVGTAVRREVNDRWIVDAVVTWRWRLTDSEWQVSRQLAMNVIIMMPTVNRIRSGLSNKCGSEWRSRDKSWPNLLVPVTTQAAALQLVRHHVQTKQMPIQCCSNQHKCMYECSCRQRVEWTSKPVYLYPVKTDSTDWN